jgi:hypothetical protein
MKKPKPLAHPSPWDVFFIKKDEPFDPACGY